jgi:hypothetical protein
MGIEQLIGKTLEEAVRVLTEQGYLVALRYVDGALTYPVYVDGEGTPSSGLGHTVPKARLDVQNGVVTGVEVLPVAAATTS